MDKVIIRNIAKLELKPLDILVVKVKGQHSREALHRLQLYMGQMLDDNKIPNGVMVLDDTSDISILTREEIESKPR